MVEARLMAFILITLSTCYMVKNEHRGTTKRWLTMGPMEIAHTSQKDIFALTCSISVINFECSNMFVKAVPVALSKQVGTKGCYRLIYKPNTSGAEPACRKMWSLT